MKAIGVIFAATLALSVAALGAMAAHKDVHAEKFPCTRCHVKTPGDNDTLETAPLVMPTQELCNSCHKGGD